MEEGFHRGKILLNEPKAIYYSGQVISGQLEFLLNSPLTYRALMIKFSGKATVAWTEKESEVTEGVKRTREVEYKGHQDYFQFEQCVSGGEGTSHFSPGRYSFPFQYKIPDGAPSSFVGEKGRVAYSVTAYLVYSANQYKMDEIVKDFNVIAPLDMNTGSERLREPIEMELEEYYSCSWFCDARPVAVRVRLPVSGYCPGQRVPVAVQAHNDSAYEITRIILQIVQLPQCISQHALNRSQKERYKSLQPPSEYISEEKVLAQAKRGPVLGGGARREFRCELPVPAMLAVNLDTCSVIDLGYFFKVIIKLSGCNEDMSDDCEMCIGLVPLRETTAEPYVHPLRDELPLGPHAAPGPPGPPAWPHAAPGPPGPPASPPPPYQPGGGARPSAPFGEEAPPLDIGFVVPRAEEAGDAGRGESVELKNTNTAR